MTPELDILMKVTLVLLLGLIATRLAARARASVRYLLLASTLGALIALPLAAALAPDLVVAIQLPQAADPGAAPADAAAFARAQAAARPEGLVSCRGHIARRRTRQRGRPRPGCPFRPRSDCCGLPAPCCCSRFSPTRSGQVRAVRRSGIPWLAGQTAAEALARESGIRRPLTVILHEDVPAPVTCGWSRPTIVLPMDARDWSESDLRRAFVHELEHVRRGDWPMQLAARAICAGVLVSSARLGRVAPALSRERARLRRCRGQPGGAGRLRGTAGDPGGAAGAQPRAAGAVDGQSQRPLRARQGRARSHAAPRPRGRVAGGGDGGRRRASSFWPWRTVRVEAVPDQRANAAGGRRASAVGNDRVRASTRALNVAIVEAAQEGDVDEVTELLSDGADVNAVVPATARRSSSPRVSGHRDLVRLLLDRGADANIGVAGDGNALIMAAREGHRDIVEHAA